MSEKTFAPVVLLVYNRPEHVKRGIESLLRNAEAPQTDLYIFSDAARTPADEAKVSEVRKIVHGIKGFKKVVVTERQNNIGLAANVTGGVTEVVNSYGRVIVLEDDLVVAPYFLRFMNDALETYKDEERVGHIQACDFTRSRELPPTFLIKWTGSWGWATWARAWKLYNPDGSALLHELEDRHLTNTFDFNGKYIFTKMLRNQVEGKNDSWAIRWNASLFLHDVLSLNVGRSLVSNVGLDGSGTNSTALDPYTSDLWMEPLPVEKIIPIQENLDARHIYELYYAHTYTLWNRARQRLAQIMARWHLKKSRA